MDSRATGPDRPVSHEAVHRLVARQATMRPMQAAVRYRETQLTYAELDARANRLAHLLRSRGVTPGDMVVTCLEPELDVPAVLLALLKVGAAYVPVDPTYPAARITMLLADVAPRLVVTRRALAARLGVDFGKGLLALDDDAALIAAAPASDPQVGDDPDRIATIFHTSGTTGRPKGARATHRNVAFFAHAVRLRYALAASDVLPVIARFTFSISIFELLVPLTAGATILVLDRETIMDAQQMARTFEEVTFFHAGPSLLKGILAAIRDGEGQAERYARVRHASSGGDMVPPQLLTEMRALFAQAQVFVIYGCSEISCMGCTDEIPRTGAIDRTYVGLPFIGTEVRVLGEDRRTVPAGEVGEVWFAGPGVIAGYLDRPQLEAERFVMIDGRRFYRTGDVGRFWEGRGVELLGRTDFQVKIRGMRVECAEVEYHLRQVPGVRDAAVVGRELRGEKVLAAFVVRDTAVAPSSAVDATELSARVRRALSERVPDYMIPAAVVELAALPLNHNLKLDRLALPALSDRAEQQAPRTDTERWLASVWCELLGLRSVGRRENFFELGGDSLLAMQVVVRADRELGVTLEGMALVRENLAEIAAICDAQRAGGQGAAIEAAPVVEPAPGLEDAIRLESFHFGPSGSLYGLLTAPATVTTRRAVLICGPVGSDDVRPAFVLTLLARRLAEAGISAMRFDWFGTRDSLGESQQGHPARWREDILAARAELVARTGATEVVGIGVRLGATLLQQTRDEAAWARLVLWDPVLDGAAHVARLAEMHEQNVASLLPVRLRRRTRKASGRRELLNFTWSLEALEAVRALSLAFPPLARTPVGWLATSERSAQRAAFDASTRGSTEKAFIDFAFEPAWGDPRRVLDIMPDSGIVKALTSLARVVA